MASKGRVGLAAWAAVLTTVALLVDELAAEFAGTEFVGPVAAGLVVYVLLYGVDPTSG